MMISYLRTKYSTEIDEGLGALEAGNIHKAESHFKRVLEHEDDPHMTISDSIEAHNGMGAAARAHSDFFDAWRWYKEAEYLLDCQYQNKWPARLHWSQPHDRPALRTLIGLGHTAFARDDTKTARKYYKTLIDHDRKDELGIRAMMAALAAGKHFNHHRHWKK